MPTILQPEKFALFSAPTYNRLTMPLPPLQLQTVQLTYSQLRWGLLNGATSVVLLVVGFGGFALFFLRRKSRDLTLIYFGIFCILYSVRLLTTLAIFQALTGWSVNVLTYLNWFITCTIVIPFFFFLYQVVGDDLRTTWEFARLKNILTICLTAKLIWIKPVSALSCSVWKMTQSEGTSTVSINSAPTSSKVRLDAAFSGSQVIQRPAKPNSLAIGTRRATDRAAYL